MKFDIHADCGAFGVARAEIPMPLSYQGRVQKFELGASAEYPSGKGRTLRFGDAIPLRTNEQFVNVRQTLASAVMLAGGGILLHRPAYAKLLVPRGVSPDDPCDSRIDAETLWRIGDSGSPTSSPEEVSRRLSEILSGASPSGHE
ncbi:MAG TPA: hypothetical protein VKB78_14105 [Pirellulales bacterium]|nr:hypothetical protein [Pirellulales bacterium]